MSDEPSDVIGSLPTTRPHRRSDRRGPVKDAGAVEPETRRAPTPSKAGGTPKAAGTPKARGARKAGAGGTSRAAADTGPGGPRAGRAGPTAKRPPANVRSRSRAKVGAKPDTAPEPTAPSPEPPRSTGPLETAVRAGAELTEVGLRAGARALRGVLTRLPRP